MRKPLDASGVQKLLRELAAAAPRKGHFRIYLTGGTTAIERGWRPSTLDADLSADNEAVFQDVQRLKETLNLNIEFVKPTDFVPSLKGEAERHVFIKSIGNIDFFHFDPYAQAFSKIVRGFERDLKDADSMVAAGWVNLRELAALVTQIPDKAFQRYPSISKKAVVAAVEMFRR